MVVIVNSRRNVFLSCTASLNLVNSSPASYVVTGCVDKYKFKTHVGGIVI